MIRDSMPNGRAVRSLHGRLSLAVLLALSPLPASAQERLLTPAEATAAGALLIGALLLDPAIDAAVPSGGGERWAWASDALNHGGRPHYAAAGLGALWLGGRATRAPQLSAGALRVGAALAAAGAVNGTLKYVVGRERPSATDDPGRFRPLNPRNRWQSFPSGHTVVAFSLAAAASAELEHPAATALAYGGAALVGWSRVYEDKHWASDVAAGALVGVVSSRAVRVLLDRPESAASIAVSPTAIAIRVPVP